MLLPRLLIPSRGRGPTPLLASLCPHPREDLDGFILINLARKMGQVAPKPSLSLPLGRSLPTRNISRRPSSQPTLSQLLGVEIASLYRLGASYQEIYQSANISDILQCPLYW